MVSGPRHVPTLTHTVLEHNCVRVRACVRVCARVLVCVHVSVFLCVLVLTDVSAAISCIPRNNAQVKE